MREFSLGSVRATLACLVILVGTPALAEDEERESRIFVEYPTSNPVELGTGWSLADNARVYQKCILFDTQKLVFQDKRALASVVEDHEALSNALELSITAKYNGALSNFSANASYVHQTKFDSDSTYVALIAEVSEGPSFVIPKNQTTLGTPEISIARVTLHPEFAKLASQNIDEFRRQCGQGFVAVIQSGAKINATLRFDRTSSEEHEKITASVSGGGGGGSFSASLTKTMDEFEKSQKLTVSYLGLGGAQDSIPLTKEGLLKAVEMLPAQSRAAPRPFTMLVQRYEDLPNWPQVIIPAKISDIEILARAYWRLFTLRQYAEEALFEDGWMLSVDTSRGAVLKLEARIQDEMKSLRDHLWRCATGKNCDATQWANWHDYEIRAQLPFKGSWSDIQYDPNRLEFEEIAKNLAAARMDRWVIPAWRARCLRGECITAISIEEIGDAIEEKVMLKLN